MEQCRKALEIDPNYWPAYEGVVLAIVTTGWEIADEALKAFERGVAVGPGLAMPIASLAAEYARSGNREQARKAIEQLNHFQTYVAPCLLRHRLMSR